MTYRITSCRNIVHSLFNEKKNQQNIKYEGTHTSYTKYKFLVFKKKYKKKQEFLPVGDKGEGFIRSHTTEAARVLGIARRLYFVEKSSNELS